MVTTQERIGDSGEAVVVREAVVVSEVVAQNLVDADHPCESARNGHRKHDLSALVSTTPSDLQVDQIEKELLASAAPTARQNYGVEMEQIRLERIALPEENVTAVLQQMRAERRQFAAKYQAEGEREASKVRSDADLAAARIVATGAEEEAKLRGQSAAQVAKIYATAHKLNPELYRFTRSLDSLDRLVTSNTSLILRTDSEPFSLLQSKTP